MGILCRNPEVLPHNTGILCRNTGILWCNTGILCHDTGILWCNTVILCRNTGILCCNTGIRGVTWRTADKAQPYICVWVHSKSGHKTIGKATSVTQLKTETCYLFLLALSAETMTFQCGTQWSKFCQGYVPKAGDCVPKWDAVSMLKHALNRTKCRRKQNNA